MADFPVNIMCLCILLTHTYTNNSYVISEPYSRVPSDCNWRDHVVDIDVFVSGPLHMLPRLQEMLKGKNMDLHGLTISTTRLLISLIQILNPVYNVTHINSLDPLTGTDNHYARTMSRH